MLIHSPRFNIYLPVLMAVLMLLGCQSTETSKKKKLALLRVHIEATTPVPNRTREVSVLRLSPLQLHVEPTPFLTEEFVRNAQVIDTIGGFALQVEFNRSGRHLLQQYTVGNQTRRLAIFSRFADPANVKNESDRWLAAPRISHAITNGMLVFTPDATREEADQIALGLRNVAGKLGTAKEPLL